MRILDRLIHFLPWPLFLVAVPACLGDPDESTASPELAVSVEAAPISSWVTRADDGKLAYHKDSKGNRIPDFSHAGYRGGGVALPVLQVKKTVGPGAGDDRARIQAAIDEVAAMAPDSHGLRGAVFLKKGRYEIGDQIKITASGVVLRGAGDGDDGTVLVATGTGRRALISVGKGGSAREVSGSRKKITDAYVPVGATSFQVEDASGFHVGDTVQVRRPSTQDWFDLIGADDCASHGSAYDTADANGSTCLANPWKPGSKDLVHDRVITKIAGKRVTIDVPIVNALDRSFGGGTLARYTFADRITQVGVESLRGESAFASDTDEEHSELMIDFRAVQDGWVKGVTGVHFSMRTIAIRGGSKQITVQDSTSLDPKSKVTGVRRYSFYIEGATQVLFVRCHADDGRHDFVLGATTVGPNVYLDSDAGHAHDDIGPHHRWSPGALFDNIVTNRDINVRNRGNSGSGHGWAGAYNVIWNSEAGRVMTIQNPPGAYNWAIGCKADRMGGNGVWEHKGTLVWPDSLYRKQLEDRLGASALDALDE